jgi:hypothetical protein
MGHDVRVLVFASVLLCATTVLAQERVVVVPLGKKPVGDATAADVVAGKTFSSNSGVGLAGTRPPGMPAATGQTLCYSTNPEDCGTIYCEVVDCANTGEDGEFQTGAAVASRFTDNGNGTVTDNLTGLIWLQEGNCIQFFSGDPAVSNARPWVAALAAVAQLAGGHCGLADGSAAGDWRLPNLRELQGLVDYSQIDPTLLPGHPFSDTLFGFYWSSTTVADFTNYGWLVDFHNGDVHYKVKSESYYVRAVRGGQ